MISMNRTHLFLTVNMMKSGAPPEKVVVLHLVLSQMFYRFIGVGISFIQWVQFKHP